MKILLGDYRERLIKYELNHGLGISEVWIEQDNIFVKCANNGDVWQLWIDYEGQVLLKRIVP